ncbi:MAG: pentapeptide repeat-containing protein, partial [Phycisphaeraceae bacterium]|nr:pentapeptide repeat-containing protein [Phycisphaeraceae bacterium]
GVNLSIADLSGANLNGANLSFADLTNADLRNSDAAEAITAAQLRAAASVLGTNLSGNSLNGFDLSGMDLDGVIFTGADLTGANLSGADLRNGDAAQAITVAQLRSASSTTFVNLSGNDLSGLDIGNLLLESADLSGTDFSGSNLRSINLTRANLNSANLAGANLAFALFAFADLTNADLRHSDAAEAISGDQLRSAAALLGANLSGNNMSGLDLSGGIDFSGVNFSATNLSNAKLGLAVFSNANLTGADLSGADLRNNNAASAISAAQLRSAASVTGVNLAGNSFAGVDLSGINLSDANLSHTNLSNTNLTSANLTSANLKNSNFSGATLTGVNFHQAALPSALPTLPVISGASVTVGERLTVAGATTVDAGGQFALNAAFITDSLELRGGDVSVNAPAGIAIAGVATDANLTLVERGGSFDNNNLAAGQPPFALDQLDFGGLHLITNLNDLTYGNSNSWIGNGATGVDGRPIAGIGLDTSQTIGSIAWGRDNLDAFDDRDLGTYTVQYRNDGSTADDGGWITIGEVTYTEGDAHLRHRYHFDAVDATAIRLLTPDALTAIDEIELYGTQYALDVAGLLTVRTGSTLLLNGGLMRAGSLHVAGGVIDSTGGSAVIQGKLTNDGTVDGPTGPGHLLSFLDDVDGAGSYTGAVEFRQTFSPGNSPAVVSLETVILTDSSTLEIELAGLLSGEFDRLEISGDATLDGLLDVSLIDGFTLDANQEFEILDIAGTQTSQFTGLGEGALVDSFNGTELFITYQAGDGNDVGLYTAVPEPSSLALLTLGGLLIVRRRRA